MYNYKALFATCYNIPRSMLFILSCHVLLNNALNMDPDFNATTVELIQRNGYPVEVHKAITSDFYVLTLHRIPKGRKAQYKHKCRPPVLIMHGLLSSSSYYVVNSPEHSLGYILADAGYDVWLGNQRGNTYSRENLIYSPDTSEFWDYSVDDQALKDIPALVDFILEKTEEKSLSFIAYSLATRISLAFLSKETEYNEKVNNLILLSPSVFAVSDQSSGQNEKIGPLLEAARECFSPTLKIFPDPKSYKDFKESGYCHNPNLKVIYDFAGLDLEKSSRVNQSRIPVYLSRYPAGSSFRTIKQLVQLGLAQRFQMYDYETENFLVYGTEQPPEYDLGQVTTPTTLIHSHGDLYADPQTVNYIKNRLPNVVEDYLVSEDNFAHEDYVYSNDASRLVYPVILKRLLLSCHKRFHWE